MGLARDWLVRLWQSQDPNLGQAEISSCSQWCTKSRNPSRMTPRGDGIQL